MWFGQTGLSANRFETGVGGPTVPPDQMSPQTHGPRTSCPPGCVVLGSDDPRQDRMSPIPFNAHNFKLSIIRVSFELLKGEK